MTEDRYRHVRDIKPAPNFVPATKQAGSRTTKAVLAALSVATLAISGIGYSTIGRLGEGMSSASNLNLGNRKGQGFKDNTDGAADILLVGSDSRADAQGNPLSDEELAKLNAGVDGGEQNTDTLMVIRVPNDGSRATAVSIPRDTYIHDAEFGNMKINGVYTAHKHARMEELVADNEAKRAAGTSESGLMSQKDIELAGVDAGRAALLDAIRNLTGIDIDHYAEIGLLGFVLLTDAVGGVDVCLNEAVNDEMSGARFPAGQQTISGTEALAFVRQRYGLPRGDLDRIVRQQAYMASLVNKMLSTGVLTSPSTLNSISQAVERSVVIDENWDVMGFATQLANLAGGNVTFNTIPVTSVDGVGDYGESIVTVDPNQVHKFFDDLAQSAEATAAPTPTESRSTIPGESPVADGLDLTVLNAGSVSGLGHELSAWLSAVGYSISETANAVPGTYFESQIVAADATDPAALALAQQLGGLPVTVNDSLEPGSFVVVVADNYAGPTMSSTSEDLGPTTAPENVVGTPGEDFGNAEVSPKIDAGGTGPRCIN
ncbi:MAG: LCP family protein [Corynebacterium sp.]|nr:LCP family protein [Corynebacterium sp.]